MTELRYTERALRARAERVIAGTQTGRYTKLEMARDLLTLLDRIERMRALSVALTMPGGRGSGKTFVLAAVRDFLDDEHPLLRDEGVLA